MWRIQDLLNYCTIICQEEWSQESLFLSVAFFFLWIEIFYISEGKPSNFFVSWEKGNILLFWYRNKINIHDNKGRDQNILQPQDTGKEILLLWEVHNIIPMGKGEKFLNPRINNNSNHYAVNTSQSACNYPRPRASPEKSEFNYNDQEV